MAGVATAATICAIPSPNTIIMNPPNRSTR